MIWLHQARRHQIERIDIPATWLHGGQRPKSVLVRCSCGKAWVRR